MAACAPARILAPPFLLSAHMWRRVASIARARGRDPLLAAIAAPPSPSHAPCGILVDATAGTGADAFACAAIARWRVVAVERCEATARELHAAVCAALQVRATHSQRVKQSGAALPEAIEQHVHGADEQENEDARERGWLLAAAAVLTRRMVVVHGDAEDLLRALARTSVARREPPALLHTDDAFAQMLRAAHKRGIHDAPLSMDAAIELLQRTPARVDVVYMDPLFQRDGQGGAHSLSHRAPRGAAPKRIQMLSTAAAAAAPTAAASAAAGIAGAEAGGQPEPQPAGEHADARLLAAAACACERVVVKRHHRAAPLHALAPMSLRPVRVVQGRSIRFDVYKGGAHGRGN